MPVGFCGLKLAGRLLGGRSSVVVFCISDVSELVMKSVKSRVIFGFCVFVCFVRFFMLTSGVCVWVLVCNAGFWGGW